MAQAKTSEAVRRFKNFLKRNPEIIAYVRQHHLKWNDVFDDWVILGESDQFWRSYKSHSGPKRKDDDTGKKNGITWNKVLETLDTIDTKQWQERLDTISGAIGGIQSLITQLKQKSGNEKAEASKPDSSAAHGQSARTGGMPVRNRRPFLFRKD